MITLTNLIDALAMRTTDCCSIPDCPDAPKVIITFVGAKRRTKKYCASHARDFFNAATVLRFSRIAAVDYN